MSNQNVANPQQPSFVEHLFQMPRFHKGLLTLAVLLFGSGLTGQAVGYFSAPPADNTAAVAPVDATNATAQPVAANPQDQSQPAQPPQQTWQQQLFARLSPHMTRVGLGFIAGFVIGWVFRAFLKIMSLVTTGGVMILCALSYFHVMNIDFTAVEKKYQSDMAWVTDQAGRAVKALLNQIPGSASGVGGVFIGFRRRY